MASGGLNESNSNVLAGMSEKKIFHELDVHHIQKVGFTHSWCQECEMSSGNRNESNGNVLAGMSEKKIFHELDVHHV